MRAGNTGKYVVITQEWEMAEKNFTFLYFSVIINQNNEPLKDETGWNQTK